MSSDIETVKIYNDEDTLIDFLKIPLRQPNRIGPRRIIYNGVAYVEGGSEDSFYGFGEFAPERKDTA